MRNSAFRVALENEEISTVEQADVDSLEEEINNSGMEFEDDFDLTTKSIDTLQAMESIREIISKLDTITPSHKALIQAAGSMAVAGTNVNRNKVVPGLENLKNPQLANEYIGESIVDGIGSVVSHIGHLIKKIADYYQYFYTLINLEQGRIDRLRKKIEIIKRQVPNGKTIEHRIYGSKFFRYGEHHTMCRDGNEYMEKYIEACEFNVKFLEYTSEFATGDFLSSYKTLFSPLTGYDKNYKKMFMSLKNYVDKSKKISSMVKIRTNSVKIEYRSPVILGLSYLQLTEPNPVNYEVNDVDSLKEVASYYSSRFVRETKFSMNITDGASIVFKADIAYVEKLLDQAQEIVHGIEDFANFINKLSTWGTTGVLPSFVTNALFNPLVFLLASYRLLLKNSFTIFNTTSSIYNFSKGVSGSAIGVCDSLLSSPKWYRD